MSSGEGDVVSLGSPVSEDATAGPGGALPLAHVLAAVEGVYGRFVHVGAHERVALALWNAHTHAMDAAETTPYMAVTSVEKGCGKSRVLEVADPLVAKPLFTANASPAAIFREVHERGATVLMDEMDTVFGKGQSDRGEELRGLLNAGYRRGADVLRMVGQGAAMQPRRFEVFAPKMFAGIGRLPDTIADRSVPIRMQRARRGEVERLRRRDYMPEARELHGRLVATMAEHIDTLADARPELPDALDDRAADVWEPLLAIADLAGGHWPMRAREAALGLSGNRARDESIGSRLLAAMRDVFAARGQRVSSADACEALNAEEDAPWGAFRDGEGVDARTLARMLGGFGIRSGTVRLHNDTTAKGYKAEDFRDAWERYVPSEPPANVTTSQCGPHTGSRDSTSVTAEVHVTDGNPSDVASQVGCDVVTLNGVENGRKLLEEGLGWWDPEAVYRRVSDGLREKFGDIPAPGGLAHQGAIRADGPPALSEANPQGGPETLSPYRLRQNGGGDGR